jgi:hypothetical protein
MFNEYHITMDSFGDTCPANWEEIAAYLNDKIDAIVDSYGDEAEYSRDCDDEIRQVWEDYCNGKFDADITTATIDINGTPIERF